MDPRAFRVALEGYRRPSGHSQQELARVLGLHPNVLSHKLHGSDGATLRHDEVRGIVRVLASWGALQTRAQALELLALLGLGPKIFSPSEWGAAPLVALEAAAEPRTAQSAMLRTETAEPTPRAWLPPAELTPLIGREALVQQVLELLRGDARLVTLTGTGGTGKTRLALAVAAAFSQCSATAVHVVALAAIRDAELVADAVAAELGLRESTGGDRSIEAVLLEHLRTQQLLLALDNLEQVLGAARLIADVLRSAPGVRVLATSRVPLRLYGEHELRVPPLHLPAAGSSEQAILGSDAVTLFVQRARAARADFQPGPEAAELLYDVCARLDGLPLAIELAAARVRHLSLPALRDRLGRRLEVLVRGPRDAPNRQRTLRDTLDWSYALLPAARQRLFARLGMFAGGCTLEAARGVCAGDMEDEAEAEDGLWELVDSALVDVTDLSDKDHPSAEPRFRMLETVHEYALARLAASGELEQIAARHRDWYLGLAERMDPLAYDPTHEAVLEQERDNLRAALRWSLQTGEAEAGVRLGATLWINWYVRGRYGEGRARLAELLALPAAGAPARARALALFSAGQLSYCQGDVAAAETHLIEGQAAAEELGDETVEGICLQTRGHLARMRGDAASAWAFYERSLALYQRRDDRLKQAVVLTFMATLSLAQGDVERATSQAEHSLELAQQQRHSWALGNALHALGRVAQARGDQRAAQSLLEQSLAVRRGLPDQQGLTISLLDVADSHLRQGHLAPAGQVLAEVLVLTRDAGERPAAILGLRGVVRLVATSRPDEAVRLAGAARALRHGPGAPADAPPRGPVDESLELARRALGADAYATAWADGALLSMEQAIVRALQVVATPDVQAEGT